LPIDRRMTTSLRIALPAGGSVSAILQVPPRATAGFVFAHGAGAGMNHAFMSELSAALADRGIATLRYQFPFMEQGSKRPDVPAVAQAAVRAAVGEARTRLPGIDLFAGGKSFGGRMTSQAQASRPLEGVRGLVFVGFPLHPAGKPGVERAQHLQQVTVPMLFVQGTRDALADTGLLRSQTQTSQLAQRCTLHLVDGADHAFQVLVRSGRRTDGEVMEEVADAIAGWMAASSRSR
jgi:predicted alpha/beta-hydrolase family hydrolase